MSFEFNRGEDKRREFGHIIEDMVIGYLAEIPEIEEVHATSPWDDEKEHVDVIIKLEGGQEIAIDITADEVAGSIEQKIKKILRSPVLRAEHDTSGKVVRELEAPKTIAGVDSKLWSKVYDATEGDPDLIKGRKELEGQDVEILKRAKASLELLRGMNMGERELYLNREIALSNVIDRMEQQGQAGIN